MTPEIVPVMWQLGGNYLSSNNNNAGQHLP